MDADGWAWLTASKFAEADAAEMLVEQAPGCPVLFGAGHGIGAIFLAERQSVPLVKLRL